MLKIVIAILFVWMCLAIIKTVILWSQLGLIAECAEEIFKERMETRHLIYFALLIPIAVFFLTPFLLIDERQHFIEPLDKSEILELVSKMGKRLDKDT